MRTQSENKQTFEARENGNYQITRGLSLESDWLKMWSELTVFSFSKIQISYFCRKRSLILTSIKFCILSSTFMERSAKSLRFQLKQVKVTFLNLAYVTTLSSVLMMCEF